MNRLKLWVGTLCGAGLLPAAPGTWGSLFTLPAVYMAYYLLPVLGIPLLLFLTITLSLWSASANVQKYGEDPPQFVMDECTGQSVVFILAPFDAVLSTNLLILATGFILFRLFDIFKPFGIGAVEKFSGKFGILADDLLAGVYAFVCLELILLLIRGI